MAKKVFSQIPIDLNFNEMSQYSNIFLSLLKKNQVKSQVK